MEVGVEQFNTVTDETSIVAQNDKVYVVLGEVEEVIGVWAETDVDRTNNLYTGGSFDGSKLTLGTPTTAGTRVVASYIQREGLNTVSVDWIVESCETRLRGKLFDEDNDYNLQNPTDLKEKMAREYWIVMSLINAYLLLNNVNMIQSDANISTFDFSTMSKLWGEGMSADALFNRWFMVLRDLEDTLFILDADASIFTEGQVEGYWKDEDMFVDWLTFRD